MRLDSFSQPVSLDSSESVDSWNSVMFGFLSHGSTTPEHLSNILSSDPNFALGHAIKGLFYLLLGRRELLPTVQESLTKSISCASSSGISPREQVYIDCLQSWHTGFPTRSLQHLEDHLRIHPGDALAVKLGHAIRFILGDGSGMRTSLERVLPAYTDDHTARGYILGCHAFSLEETGDYALAESTGHEALRLAPDDAWGLHAVAHVFDMTANAEGGLQWLSGRESAWSHCNNFRYHVWWHKALMHLDVGQIDEVFALYDAEIRADKTDDYRDISNATSLLSRLELLGHDVGDRWEELADFASSRTQDGCLIFADLHYLLALLGDNRDASVAQLLSRLEQDAERSHTDSEQRMSSPGLSAAFGLQAFSEGDYKTAFRNLCECRKNMQLAGGSHAQRDIFERLTIDSGIRSGQLDDALLLLNDRCDKRGGHEDGYTSARRSLISQSRAHSRVPESVPAE